MKPLKKTGTLRRATQGLEVLSTWRHEVNGFWEQSRASGCIRGELELRESRKYRGRRDANGWYHLVIHKHNLPAGRSRLFIGVTQPESWEGPGEPYYVSYEIGTVRSRRTPPKPTWDGRLSVWPSNGSQTGGIEASTALNFRITGAIRVTIDTAFVACAGLRCRTLTASRTATVSPTYPWDVYTDPASGTKYRVAWPWLQRWIFSEPLTTGDALADEMRALIAAGQSVKATSRVTVRRASDDEVLKRMTLEKAVGATMK